MFWRFNNITKCHRSVIGSHYIIFLFFTVFMICFHYNNCWFFMAFTWMNLSSLKFYVETETLITQTKKTPPRGRIQRKSCSQLLFSPRVYALSEAFAAQCTHKPKQTRCIFQNALTSWTGFSTINAADTEQPPIKIFVCAHRTRMFFPCTLLTL